MSTLQVVGWIGYVNPDGSGAGNWIEEFVAPSCEAARECPICMKAILAEEWQEHQAWHAT
jgi:hypothetical protein